MRPSTLLFPAAIAALLAVSATAWPFHHPPHFPLYPPHFPIFPPHPTFPFPSGGGSAPPPSSGSASVDSASATGGDVSTANFWPFFPHPPLPPHFPFYPPYFPIFPPHPTFPFPLGGGSAPPPTSGGASVDGSGFPSFLFPPAEDMKKCLKKVHHGGHESCFPHKFDAGKCCTYLSGLEDSCTYVPYFKSYFFRGILKHVCDAGSAPPPSS